MKTPNLDVRFTPESGHVRCTRRCPLCANSELMHRSKPHLLVFTLHAPPSREAATGAVLSLYLSGAGVGSIRSCFKASENC